MSNLVELQKALDTFQKEYNGYLELTEKILPGQPKEVRDFIESMLESLTLYNLAINRIKDGFSAFKVEYDGQLHVPRFSICMSNDDYDRMVHVSRKQLSDLLKDTPNYEELDDIGGMESYGVQMWGFRVEKWIAKLKELLEGSVESEKP